MPTPEEVRDSLLRRIYNINENDFAGVAMDVFRFQYSHNPLYQRYCQLIGQTPETVLALANIPFLPIVFFRDHMVKTGQWKEEIIFRSSGTTSSASGLHYIRDTAWYHALSARCFSAFFGPPGEYNWLGLLPSYLERPDSSLVHMVKAFMTESRKPENHFYKIGDEILIEQLAGLKSSSSKVVLIGVSFALLDFFENFDVPFWDDLIVIETGGMKGRGREITRAELYDRIRLRHPGLHICSEYGMTEMLSQAYRIGDEFMPGPTLRILVRDISDPVSIVGVDQRGGLNVIDLGNLDTCAFIATDDAGILHPDGGFDVLGRLDASDQRGCNLMYTSQG